MRQVDWTLPCHDAKDVKREKHTGGMDLGVGAIKETGNHIRALDLCWTIGWILALEVKGGILLVAFGVKAHVVELDIIDSRLCYDLGQSDVIILDLWIRGV